MNQPNSPDYPDRLPLAHLPTPIESMERLSTFLAGPRILIKRDDQTGLAFGGNKTRKLEFLAAEALAGGCNHLVTAGAAQSNHCRQTAAAAAKLGLKCSLVFPGSAPPENNGNLLLDTLLGANLNWSGKQDLSKAQNEVARDLKLKGDLPYVIPVGGSNVIGATGYVLAMEELFGQLDQAGEKVDVIVFASSSGGTQAGIVVGSQFSKYTGRILAISVEHSVEELTSLVTKLASATAVHLGIDNQALEKRIEVNDKYIGRGYGVVGDLEREAILLVAQLEGILLDPVYTGRAMGGLIDLIRMGMFTPHQTVLFWHTGGTPAIFAYDKELL